MIRPFNSLESSFRIRDHNHKKAQYQISHFVIGQKLGQGGYAKVYKAVEKFTKLELAAKVIDIRGYHQKEIERLRQEVEIHRSLNHPNIVRIYQCVEKDSKFYIFMELVKGQELFQHIRERGPIPQDKAAKVFSQICQAVKYLHSNGIVHRDIKTENIVIDKDYNAKLIDFGLAKRFKEIEKNLLSTFCGSQSYASPQMVEKKRYNSQKIDIWCLGVMLYTMLQAKLPFDQNGDQKRKENISAYRWDRPYLSSFEAMKLYEQIFVGQSDRISLNSIICSRFLDRYSRSLDHNDYYKNYREKQEQKKEQIVEEIVKLLSQEEKQVKIQILEGTLGPAYCLYHLINGQRERKQKTSYRKKTMQKQKDSLQSLRLGQQNRKRPQSTKIKNKLIYTPPQKKIKYQIPKLQMSIVCKSKLQTIQQRDIKEIMRKAQRTSVRLKYENRVLEMKIKQ